ncbi:MAG: flagellar filament capping protein FliD [Chromatiales bacterium]|nr:flagellar filament capping protein FliD [Chromatiales bacterium]
MAITATGIGSGIDVKGLVEQLVSAERQPVANRLTTREARANSQLSALGQLKGALAALRDAVGGVSDLEALRKRAVTVAPQDIVTATATTRAATGSVEVEVLALATSQRLASPAFASADSVVGTGTLGITAGGVPLQIVIDESNSTLAGIRDAINGAPGNTGVRASIVNADGGAYLVLSATATGLAGGITVDAVEPGSGLEALEYGPGTTGSMTEQQAAGDARVRLDGLTVTAGTNVLSDAVDGLRIDLRKAEPGTIVRVDVADDVIALKQAIKGFVDAYNGVVDTVGRLTSYNRDNRSAGPLLGDGPTRNVLAALRSALAGRSGSGGGTLVDVGIRSDVSGRLGIDVARLDRAIDGDVDGLRQLFAAEGSGLADRLAPVLAGALDTGGIANREDRIKDQLRSITAGRQQLDLRMDQVRRRLERQFNSLDQLVQQLNTSGNFLLQALNRGQ